MKNLAVLLRPVPATLRMIGLLALLAFTAVSSASADTIDVSQNFTATVNISSPNDNFWGEYVNVVSEPFENYPPQARGNATLPISNFSVTVPTGSTITQALVTYTVLSNTLFG